MKLFYSAGTGGFYSSQISGNDVPSDAVEITSEEHVELLSGLRQGRLIHLDAEGRPVLGDIPVPVEPSPIDVERAWRDAELSAVVWLRDRHRDQLEIGAATTLSDGQFKELLVYIQALREWPQSVSFPDLNARPIEPLWLAEAQQGDH